MPPTLGEVEESAQDTMRGVMAELAGKAEGHEEPAEPQVDGDIAGAPETERPRDERGRFARREDETAEPVVEPVAAEPGAAAEPAAPVEEEEIDPPYEWSAEEQDAFRALPPAAKTLVLTRVNEAREATQWAVERSRHYGALEQVIAGQRDAWAREGLDEAGGVRQLIGLSEFAARDPQGFINWFAQQRGIQLSQQQVAEAGQPDQGGYVDPEVAALRQELNGFRTLLSQQQHAAQQQQHQSLQSELRSFIDAKDAAGRPAHPYFEEVRSLMGSLYGSGKATNLDQAYDMACRADPGVNAKINSAKRAAAEKEQARINREKAATARQAGSSVSGTPGDNEGASEPSGDIREDMRRQFREQGLI